MKAERLLKDGQGIQAVLSDGTVLFFIGYNKTETIKRLRGQGVTVPKMIERERVQSLREFQRGILDIAKARQEQHGKLITTG